jgi:hypothetical protein
MYEKIDWHYLFSEARARVYLLWVGISLVGFTAVHYSTSADNANIFWIMLSLAGLGYMYKAIPMRLKPGRQIFAAWLWTIVFGAVVSIAAFRVRELAGLSAYLGAFWLLVMAAGYFLNGLFDAPATWYWVAVALNVAAALLIILFEPFMEVQWLVVAIISAWSMLNLWLFRSELV